MTHSYWRTERLIVGAVERRILGGVTVSDRTVSVFTNPDLLVVAAFCIIGLLASLVAMLTLPGFGEFADALQQML